MGGVEHIDNQYVIEISASLPSTTKTENNGLDTKWSAGDRIHVWHKPVGSADSEYVDDGAFTLTGDPEAGIFSGSVSKLSIGTGYDWKITYPYGEETDEWPVQAGNNSTAHLCGAACPLQGFASNQSLLSDKMGIAVMMDNTMAVAKIVVSNSNEYAMTVTTVRVGGKTLLVKDGAPIAKGGNATFYVPVEPFTSSNFQIAVDGYSKTVSSSQTFTAGHIKTVNFNYNNSGKKVQEGTVFTSNRYSSFPDLIHFGNKFYCVFREAGGHVVHNKSEKGDLYFSASQDGVNWSAEELVIKDDTGENGFDLRDPHFVESMDGSQIYVYYGRNRPTLSGEDGYYPTNCSYMSILKVNASGKLEHVSTNPVNLGAGYSTYWLWSVTRHEDAYYGVAYNNTYGKPVVFKSADGINFQKLIELNFDGSEASISFVGSTAYVFTRASSTTSYISYAEYPYTSWTSTIYTRQMDCPYTLPLWDKIFVCARGYHGGTSPLGIPVYAYDPASKNLDVVYDVYKSGSDRAYPGMVIYDDKLHIVYYADKNSNSKPDIYFHITPLAKLYELTTGSGSGGSGTGIFPFSETTDILYI